MPTCLLRTAISIEPWLSACLSRGAGLDVALMASLGFSSNAFLGARTSRRAASESHQLHCSLRPHLALLFDLRIIGIEHLVQLGLPLLLLQVPLLTIPL